MLLPPGSSIPRGSGWVEVRSAWPKTHSHDLTKAIWGVRVGHAALMQDKGPPTRRSPCDLTALSTSRFPGS